MAGGVETPNIAALPAIARLGTCESARDPDADRHVKLLIQFAVEGSLSGAYSHYRIHLCNVGASELGPDVGAGWKRSGEKAGDYISLRLDDPSFGQPIRAGLFQTDDQGLAFDLLWNRPPRRQETA